MKRERVIRIRSWLVTIKYKFQSFTRYCSFVQSRVLQYYLKTSFLLNVQCKMPQSAIKLSLLLPKMLKFQFYIHWARTPELNDTKASLLHPVLQYIQHYFWQNSDSSEGKRSHNRHDLLYELDFFNVATFKDLLNSGTIDCGNIKKTGRVAGISIHEYFVNNLKRMIKAKKFPNENMMHYFYSKCIFMQKCDISGANA